LTTVPNGASFYGGPEIRRRVIGSLLELGIKAYGAAAAVSVAFSDAETASGKLHDAVAAVPNLTERYREAKYALDHRAEIQTALEYVHRHAPDPQQLETAARDGSDSSSPSTRRIASFSRRRRPSPASISTSATSATPSRLRRRRPGTFTEHGQSGPT